ncbi:immunoglobulin superfamily DCC subclass member 4-like [Amblyomma americanum]
MEAPVSGGVGGTPAGTSSTSQGSAGSGGFQVSTSPLSKLNAGRYAAEGLYVPRSFECDVIGSRPHSNVTWFLDGHPLGEHLSHTRHEGNITKSVLLLPAREHAGKLLECRSSNSYLPRGRREFSRYLAVDLSDKPEVSLKLGAGLNASHITEGTDVYMECSVLAPSRIGDVTWLHDGQELQDAPAEGKLITSRYLVMRRVNPSHSGSYSCRVNGAAGDNIESAAFHLRVKYSPKCDPDEEQMLHVERDAVVNVTCNVKADPRDGLRYFWLLENQTHISNASKKSKEGPRRKQSSRPLMTFSSYLEVVANDSLFEAVLACWAENAVGMQKKPCRFTFTHKGEHSSGLTCTVGNYTDTSFSLLCLMPPGENGTTSTRDPRPLLVEVLAAGQQERSERSFWGPDLGAPVFVTGLLPSTDYLVVVRLPPDASFRTYVRTLGLAQTLKGRDDLTRSTQPGLWNTTLSIVVLTCAVAAALAALLGIYLVHAFKERWKKTRRSSTDFGNSAKAKDADSLYIRDQKSYVTAAECC